VTLDQFYFQHDPHTQKNKLYCFNLKPQKEKKWVKLQFQ